MPSTEFVLPVQAAALAVRWIHFIALAAILGGALAVALPDRPSLTLARRYEFLFWVAIGLVVVSGIGNVGRLAPNVPAFESRWGRLFALKLIAVVGLIAVSTVRSGIVARTGNDGDVDRRWYLLTAGWVAALAAIAVVMARG